MFVQLPLILSLLTFVAAFSDHGDEVCNRVCKKTSKCIRKLDDDNNMICNDIKGVTEIKCTLVCERNQPSEIMSDHLGEDIMYSEADQNFDPNDSLLNTISSLTDNSHSMDKKIMHALPSFKDIVETKGISTLSSMFMNLIKDSYDLFSERSSDYNHKSKRSLNELQNKRAKRYLPCGPYGCHPVYGPHPAYIVHPVYAPHPVYGPYYPYHPYPYYR